MTAAAIATRDTSGALGIIDTYRQDFATVLPAHVKPDQFVRLSQGLLRRNPDLRRAAEQNVGSFLAVLLECARLGHEPGTDQYALTHFNNKRTGKPEIVGIEQYQGEIERMYRAGAVQSVRVEVVREHDDFAWHPTEMKLPHHRFDALADDETRGPLRGVYAFAWLQGGAISQVIVMGRGEVMKHKAVAKTTKFWEGPWEPDMWRKTAIHALEKYVPTSSEYRREQLRAAVEADRLRDVLPPVAVPPVPASEPEPEETVDVELLPPADVVDPATVPGSGWEPRDGG